MTNSLDKQRKVISIIVTENDGKDDSILIKEIKDLKEKLLKANKTIEEQKTEIQDLKYKITMIKSEGMSKINNLMETIEKKDNKIKNLEEKLNKNNPKNKTDTIAIQITSADFRINYPIVCHGTQSFSEIEAKLYKEFPEFRDTNNNFLYNGTVVKRFKTINENDIKNGAHIMLISPEDYD